MAARGVHEPPYQTARALAAWARWREPYLRGRLILVGDRWANLNLQERLDVAEVVLVTDGEVDRALSALQERISILAADDETWGETEEAARGTAKAEKDYEQAKPLTPEQRADRERRKAEIRRRRQRPVRTGNPLEAGIMNMRLMAAARARRLADSPPMGPETEAPA